MHILEIPSFFPPYGGAFCLEQAKALVAQGHEVRILSNVQLGISIGLKDYLTLSYRRYEHEMDGVMVYQSYQRGLPKRICFNVNRWVSIVRSMFREYVEKHGRPDILHAHCAKWAGYASMLISQEYGIPYVITEHLPLMLLEDEFGKAPSNAWQISLLKSAYKNASIVLPVSEELVDDTACYYGKDYRWQYVSNTIDTGFFHYQRREPKEGRAFRFCCLADYYYRKGYDVLFEAMRQLQQSGVSIELHIAGLFTDSRACRTVIENLGLKDVTCYGRLDKKGVRDLLYRSDSLVLASRSEVQPLVLLEAMSTGIPVVSTECVPRCQRLSGCTIVPIGDAEALARAMRTVAEQPQNQGIVFAEEVRRLASPAVVGRQLETIFKEILEC